MPLSASALAMKSLSVRSLLTQAPPCTCTTAGYGSGAGRAVEPRQQRLPALALVFDILDPHPGTPRVFGFERRAPCLPPATSSDARV